MNIIVITVAVLILAINVIPNNARGLPDKIDDRIQDLETVDGTTDCEMLSNNDKICKESIELKELHHDSNETVSDSDDEDTGIVANASQRRSRVLNMSIARQASSGLAERVVRMVRSMMGLSRNEPSRFTRQAIGVMTGHSQCRQKIFCQFGKMFSGFRDADMIFGFIEHISPSIFKKTCGIMRRAAAKIEDCTNYLCDV